MRPGALHLPKKGTPFPLPRFFFGVPSPPLSTRTHMLQQAKATLTGMHLADAQYGMFESFFKDDADIGLDQLNPTPRRAAWPSCTRTVARAA